MSDTRLSPLGPAVEGKLELWRYRCVCGSEIVKPRRTVAYGRIKSCGCLNDELRAARNAKHGLAGRAQKRPDTYWLWVAMKQRCTNPKAISYPWYGARGIRVCERWTRSYIDFMSDMGPRPTPQHSIDRIDGNGNYEPANCRWATKREQALNRRPRAAA